MVSSRNAPSYPYKHKNADKFTREPTSLKLCWYVIGSLENKRRGVIGAIPYSAQNKGRDVVPMEVADGEGKCALRDEIKH